jgi:hypothetical protein
MLIKPVFLAAILVAAFQIDINGIKRTFIEIPKRFRWLICLLLERTFRFLRKGSGS